MRVELLTKGIPPGRLGSPRDHTLRRFLAKQKKAESSKLMATLSSSLGNADGTKEAYTKYIAALWYEDVRGDHHAEMLKYYNEQVKDLKPTITYNDGQATIGGLNA